LADIPADCRRGEQQKKGSAPEEALSFFAILQRLP
jgi:hypothetical protein